MWSISNAHFNSLVIPLNKNVFAPLWLRLYRYILSINDLLIDLDNICRISKGSQPLWSRKRDISQVLRFLAICSTWLRRTTQKQYSRLQALSIIFIANFDLEIIHTAH